ncbi:hypothetical protein SLA2020_482160 [Shorea laevis]
MPTLHTRIYHFHTRTVVKYQSEYQNLLFTDLLRNLGAEGLMYQVIEIDSGDGRECGSGDGEERVSTVTRAKVGRKINAVAGKRENPLKPFVIYMG